MKSKTPLTTALLGSLAILTTGCGTNNWSHHRASDAWASSGHAMSNEMASPHEARMALERAMNYKHHLTPRQRAMLKRQHIRYFAVDVHNTGHTSRKRGRVHVLIYDVYTGRLMNHRLIHLSPIPAMGQVITVNGYPTKYIDCGGGSMRH